MNFLMQSFAERMSFRPKVTHQSRCRMGITNSDNYLSDAFFFFLESTRKSQGTDKEWKLLRSSSFLGLLMALIRHGYNTPLLGSVDLFHMSIWEICQRRTFDGVRSTTKSISAASEANQQLLNSSSWCKGAELQWGKQLSLFQSIGFPLLCRNTKMIRLNGRCRIHAHVFCHLSLCLLSLGLCPSGFQGGLQLSGVMCKIPLL